MDIYKILRAEEWASLCRDGEIAGAPVDLADGYVHLSTAGQVRETLERNFAGQAGLELCACDTTDLGAALRWEPSRGGALFPHLYRALRQRDVRWHETLAVTEGRHVLPPLLG